MMWPNDPLFFEQWHLFDPNQLQNLETPDIFSTWERHQGYGVVIAFVDDGIDYNHEDLRSHYRWDLSYDFLDQDFDPYPTDGSNHGTMIAGIAVATGNNGVGVTGVAPQADWAVLRQASLDDAEIAQTLSYRNQEIDIYNNSWGPYDDGKTLQGPGPQTLAALRQGVQQGRGGRGNIYVWAGGNGGQNGDNVNYDGYANSRYTIAVGAVDRNGDRTPYSEPGAALLVSAFSNGAGYGIRTTDLSAAAGESAGNYTYAGLSSATVPFVSGTVALMLDANPNLGWRDVQHILVQTALRTDAGDADWVRNGAGLWVNHQYGFGLVDVGAAVAAAETWENVGPELSVSSGRLNRNQTIPDGNKTGLTGTVRLDAAMQVEWVEVVFDATHPFRGDLSLELISPAGTRSRLAETRSDGNDDYDNWVFTSARHWGELAQGEWQLRVVDNQTGDVGVWNSWQINIFGTAMGGTSAGSLGTVGSAGTVDPVGNGVTSNSNSNPAGSGIIRGSNAPDWSLVGTNWNDTLRGLGGNDRLEGLAGNDVLWGEAGDDKLFGGSGDDVLYATDWETRGRGEIDHMTGGAGGDRFILGDAGGAYYVGRGWDDFVLINDFVMGEDRVELAGGMADYRLSVQGSDTRLLSQAGEDVMAVFVGQTNLNLSNPSFRFLG